MLVTSLSGLKVIDFTQILAGPTCTMMLADFGADVVKIESPTGDLCRSLSPFAQGESLPFLATNCNKRSVVLDLKTSEHVEVARHLIAGADVLVESFRPGVMARLGLDYATVKVDNPRLIYCSISAYGQKSPWKDRPGVDGVVQAVSGLMSITGMPGAPPCKVQVPVVDIVTGYLASASVMAALALRQREGVGQYLDVSMFGSAIALQHTSFASYLNDPVPPERLGSAASYAAPNEALRCADGWIMVAAYHPARWLALCRVLGVPEIAADPRFATSADRIAHREQMLQVLEERMRLRSKNEWLELLRAEDIICGPINDYSDVVASEQFQFAGLTEQMIHPEAGPITLPRVAFADLGVDVGKRRVAPTLGQHTAEVLTEHGYSAAGLNGPLHERPSNLDISEHHARHTAD